MKSKPEISGLNVAAKERNLGLIRKFIGAGMKNSRFPRKKISALAVSVTEHCENLIRHAYKKESRPEAGTKIPRGENNSAGFGAAVRYDKTKNTGHVPEAEKRTGRKNGHKNHTGFM